MIRNIIYIVLFSLSVIVIGFSTLRIYDKYKAGKVLTLPPTKARAKEMLVNIGKVIKGNKAEAIFTIYNEGKEDLQISSVKPECHCTVPQWDTGKIRPGDSTNVRAVYDGSTPGYFQKNIFVEMNTLNSPLLLTFRGRVETF